MNGHTPAAHWSAGLRPGVFPDPLNLTHTLNLNPPSGGEIKSKIKITIKNLAGFRAAFACFACFAVQSSFASDFTVLKPAAFAHHIERFNAMEPETITNFIPNAQSWSWLEKIIPFFECPDREVEEIYYFRWWSYRKHLVKTPDGFVITEFLTPVKHAGAYNTVSCAAGFHLAEGRWLRDQTPLDDYTRFWLSGNNGKPQPHFHKFSSWFAAAAYDRHLVNGDKKFITSLLDDLVTDYRAWETERQLPISPVAADVSPLHSNPSNPRTPGGLFWQHDVKDAMEESISGSRTEKNIRPTINSYMFGNAQAIAAIAQLANKPALAQEFATKAADLKRLTQDQLWDNEAKFFKVCGAPVSDPASSFSTAREALGFIPWMFDLPDTTTDPTAAFSQITDSRGFSAPFGLTTAERRHPEFRNRGVGTCEWDGAIWPFATSQTLTALANFLHHDESSATRNTQHATRAAYFTAFLTYTRSQHAHGKPFIGEYLDEVTGDWINRGNRSAYYNHSTYADLLITGVIGLRPRADNTVEISPLLPAGTWDWFALDGVNYHGHMLTVIWDKDGTRYGRGAGLRVLANGKQITHSPVLERITGQLP